MGKTNMDQFAAGLVGTRTPFGVAVNTFDDRSVSASISLKVLELFKKQQKSCTLLLN